MTTKKSFGFELAVVKDAGIQDFEIYSNQGKGQYNPLRKEKLPNRSNNYQGSITSIPSPYARMHVTDIAFEELTDGIGVYTDEERAERGEQMSVDYTKAISHCLDMFELLFYADSLNLKESGITLKKIKLWHLSDGDNNEEFKSIVEKKGKHTLAGSYLQTLDLYRAQYMADVDARKKSLSRSQSYMFDFTSLYVFKYKNKTFAATSPFTGFFTKADCALSSAELEVPLKDGTLHPLLTASASDFCAFDKRSNQFKEFMYELFRETGLDKIFVNLYNVIQNDSYIIANQASLNNEVFSQQERFKKYNIGRDSLLQRIDSDVEVYIRPDGIDCSYLKFLLYQVEPAELTIPELSYHVDDIAKRRFPDGNGDFKPWLGANDILSDALYVLPYEINTEYKAIAYYDENDGKTKRRCLIPIKTKVLDYIDLNKLIENIQLTKRKDDSFLLRLTIHLANGGTVVLRREYYTKNLGYPFGRIITGEDMKPFAFGIYPFVHSENFNNIYKILFYNAFEEACEVEYYKVLGEHQYEPLLRTSVKHNTTNKLNPVNALPANCEYYHLDVERNKLAFANVIIEGYGNALILPEIKVIKMHAGDTTIAVDLGTSNTYVAFSHHLSDKATDDIEIQDIDTQHGTWSELIFMNNKCEHKDDPDAKDKNRKDLYLNEEGNVSHECLSAQLCEFIPSQINKEGYSFPIPSAINMLRINDARTSQPEEIIPLVNCAIPFAYYEIGTRKSSSTTGIVDLVCDGSDFKWFSKKDGGGSWQIDKIKQHQFEAFMQELLFILRSNMLSMGYDLKQCKVIWSYPLSFDDSLVRKYQNLWKKYFAVYFNSEQSNIISTNESLTPIYYCKEILATEGELSLLIDIGGGSTDIIGYKDKTPQFISSFGFAGNALYLEGSMNSPIKMDTTLLKALLRAWDKQQRINVFSKSSGSDMQPISFDSKVSVLMNYGFATDRTNFESIFEDDPMQLLLSLHNAAIMYQIAQLCKLSNQPMPLEIYLTGNGSKLLGLNYNCSKMFRAIFEHIYGEKAHKLTIKNQENPKYATARGALLGMVQEMSINENANESSKVMLGDGEYVFDGTLATLSAELMTGEKYKTLVKKNVENFLKLWYSQLDFNLKKQISEEELLEDLERIASNRRLTIQDGRFSDSLFFQYISLLMEVISYNLKEKIYGNN